MTLPGSNTAVPAQTAMREWVRFAVRTPDGADHQRGARRSRLESGQVRAGRGAVRAGGLRGLPRHLALQQLDQGLRLAAGRRRDIANERTGAVHRRTPVGAPYVFKFLRNIGSFNLGVPGGGNPIGDNIGAAEKTTPGFARCPSSRHRLRRARAGLQQRRQGQRLHHPVAAGHRRLAALLPQRRMRDAGLRAHQRQAPHLHPDGWPRVAPGRAHEHAGPGAGHRVPEVARLR